MARSITQRGRDEAVFNGVEPVARVQRQTAAPRQRELINDEQQPQGRIGGSIVSNGLSDERFGQFVRLPLLLILAATGHSADNNL